MSVEERWLPIVGYEGRYEVSDRGRVWSLISDRALTGFIGEDGYRRVQLTVGGRVKRHLVHHLVATAFIANPGNLPEVYHLDRAKLHNRVANLQWSTHAVNGAPIVKQWHGGYEIFPAIVNVEPMPQWAVPQQPVEPQTTDATEGEGEDNNQNPSEAA